MILKRELARNLKSLIVWSLIMGAIIILMLSIFPQMAEQQQSMDDLMNAYPEAMRKAFGMDTLDLGTLIGFYGVEIHMITTLLGSIYAVMLASSILSKEHTDRTIEFLLSKPVTRTRIITDKWLAVLINLILFNSFSALSSIIGFQFAANSDVPAGTFALLIGMVFLLHLTFSCIAYLLSTLLRRGRAILSVSLGVVFITYFFSIMAGISDDLHFLKYFSPFKYADAADIISAGAVEPLYAGLMLAICAACVLIACSFYRRKDISV